MFMTGKKLIKVVIQQKQSENHFYISVKRLVASHGKPDIVRVVSDLDMVMLSYSGFLMVELIRLNGVAGDDKDYLDLNRSQPETGSVCDIVIRENVVIKGMAHSWVVMVAVNTEPLDNRQQHIGKPSSLI